MKKTKIKLILPLLLLLTCDLCAQVYDRFTENAASWNWIENHSALGYSAYSNVPRPYPLRTDGQGYQHDEEKRFINLLIEKAFIEENIQLAEGSICSFSFLVNKNGKIDKLAFRVDALKNDLVNTAKFKKIAENLIQTYQTEGKPIRNYFITSAFKMPKYNIKHE